MALTSLLPSSLLLALIVLASSNAEISRPQPAVQHSPAAQSPPLYSVEELWELCERFPSLDQCEVLNNGAVPAAAAPMMAAEKRKSAYMRFGRSDPAVAGAEMEKRKSAYMRFGKRSGQSPLLAEANEGMGAEMEKRKSAYMRFGKRKSAYMRFGKRSEGVGMAPRWNDAMAAEVEKRKSAYMRFGK